MSTEVFLSDRIKHDRWLRGLMPICADLMLEAMGDLNYLVTDMAKFLAKEGRDDGHTSSSLDLV